MTAVQRLLVLFVVVVGLLATTSILYLRPTSAHALKDTFTNDSSNNKVVVCSDEVIDDQIKHAFRVKLARLPTPEELSDFRKQLKGLEVAAHNCRSIAMVLASEYISRGLHDETSKKTTTTLDNADKADKTCDRDDLISAITAAFNDKLNRAPRKSELDNYVHRLQDLDLSADECRATAKTLMAVFIDREYTPDAGKNTDDEEKKKDDKKDEKKDDTKSEMKERSAYFDVLYQGLAIAQDDQKSCANADDGSKSVETRLAKFMRDRNQTYLQNLCQQSGKTLEFERRAAASKGCSQKPPGCSDGTPYLQSTLGTTLDEATHMTRVGSVMPRFVYAEYV